MKRFFIFIVFLFFQNIVVNIIGDNTLSAQDSWWKEKKYKSEAKRQKFAICKKVFVTLSDAINYNNPYTFLNYYNDEIYLNFLNNEKGYYTSSQTYYIIENFFYTYPVSSFKWKISSRSESYAFAKGKYKYKLNGFINSFSLSISLKYINGKWLIDQIIVS